MLNHPLVRMVQLVLDKYQRDNVGGLSAALAYFTIFSIFPLLLVVISMVGFFVDPARFDVEEQLLSLIGSPEVRDLIAQALDHFSETRVGVGLLGIGTLVFAATGIFGALTRTFKVIWEARIIAGSGTFKVAVITMVLEKLIAFGLLLGCAALILASVVGNVALSLLSAYTDWLPLNAVLTRVAQLSLMVSLLTIAFAVLYKVLPDRLPAWGDVWPAAFIAAVAFTALQELAEQIFGRVNFSSFGVLGGAMTVLLWIYLCAQILLVGGELSYAWAYTLGSRRGARPEES